MSKISERIVYLMNENHYDLDELSMRAGMRKSALEAILQDQKPLLHEDAVDLSRYLGADASYLEGTEKAYYLAHRPIKAIYKNDELSTIDIHEQLLIPGYLEVNDFECILYESTDNEWGNHLQQVLLVTKQGGDGNYLVEIDGKIKEATCQSNQMYRHHQVIEHYHVLYKIEAFSLNLEDLLRKLTSDIKEGKLEFTL